MPSTHNNGGSTPREDNDMEENKAKKKPKAITFEAAMSRLFDIVGSQHISGAAIFIGVDKNGELFSTVSRVDVPAGDDLDKVIGIKFYDYDYLQASKRIELLNYGKVVLVLDHDDKDFIIRVYDGKKTGDMAEASEKLAAGDIGDAALLGLSTNYIYQLHLRALNMVRL